ncbi:MAG: TonB-dependent receptor, partial [Bacteroidota bacterium]
GQYYLNELDKQMGSDNLGDSLMNIGIGSFLEHARNYLDATVISASHNGRYKRSDHQLLWGVKIQHETVSDDINEWTMRDSAGFSLPFPDTAGYSPNYVPMYQTLISSHYIESNRATAYIQESYSFSIDSTELSITGGIRGQYWDYNGQFVGSPRISLALMPNWDRDILFKFAAGYYFQPPFYKELRDLNGNIHDDIKAQESIHFVVGSDYNFKMWKRPFKFITELYYKKLDHLIPYQVDNVRIRYYGSNNAKGYAMGVDMKLNGEFVPGVDSWASLSVMQTREDIQGDFYYKYYNADGEQIFPGFDTDSIANTVKVEPGFIPRPSDQTVNFGLFFQDYLPRNPSYKMQLSLMFGSRLPFGPPNSERYTHTLRMPAYRRVDIGFSKVLKSEDKVLPENNIFRHFKSIWVTLEVFNLLGIRNTISYLWIDDIYGRQYAVPNYLSDRRLNVKLIAKF